MNEYPRSDVSHVPRVKEIDEECFSVDPWMHAFACRKALVYLRTFVLPLPSAVVSAWASVLPSQSSIKAVSLFIFLDPI